MGKFQPRRPLPHGRPNWVSPDDALFITFASLPRESNQLANPLAWHALLGACLKLADAGRWRPQLVLAMPDHMHLIAQITPGADLKKIIGAIKRAVSSACEVRWQRDFFDHRPRNREARAETCDYVLMNPVRKGLVTNPYDWPYKWKSPSH